MNRSVAILLILILALSGILIGLTIYNRGQQMELADELASQQARVDQLENEKASREAAADRARAEAERARQEAAAAQEAQRLAEARALREEQERQARLAELNERLARESAERRVREQQLATLNARLAELAAAQQEAEAKAAELAAAQASTGQSAGAAEGATELAEVEATLAARDAEIDRLRVENERLQAEYQVALDRQIETEEEIMDRGGEITGIGVLDIRSPNYKRRQAVILRDRSGDDG